MVDIVSAVTGPLPWLEQKVRAVSSAVSHKYDVMRRTKEYEQICRWTASSLRVSSALDWGHTCDLGEEINRAATEILGKSKPNRNCWAFTSRTLVCKFTGRSIDHDLWTAVVEKATDPRWVNFSAAPPQLCVADNTLHTFEDFLNHLTDVHVLEDGDDHDDGTTHVVSSPSRRSSNEDVTQVFQQVYYLFQSNTKLHRCCDRGHMSLRRRALRMETCKGVHACPPANHVRKELTSHMFDVDAFFLLQSQWIEFLSNWDHIVTRVSEAFKFPVCPGLDDLLFHDMVTGYVAETKMLRRGGKLTTKTGTAVVHPGEQGAVISCDCQRVYVADSALDKHGLQRRWDHPATEFARYALFRCDLVSRSRMRFSEAIKDWMSSYAHWDRAPHSLSVWKDTAIEGTNGDDYRLILIRQALGYERSIDITSFAKEKYSLFEGFWRGSLVSDRRMLVIDRPMLLNVNCRIYHGFRSFKDDGQQTAVVMFDTWRKRSYHYRASEGSWYEKAIESTGRPDIFRLSTTKSVQVMQQKNAGRLREGETTMRTIWIE